MEWRVVNSRGSEIAETIVGEYLACDDGWIPPLEGELRRASSIKEAKRLCWQHYLTLLCKAFI